MTIKFTRTEDEKDEKEHALMMKMGRHCGNRRYVNAYKGEWTYESTPNLEFSWNELSDSSELKITKIK